MAVAEPPAALAVAAGAGVVIRPLEDGERGPVLDVFARLSPESRYRRFLAPTPRLTETDLARLTAIEPGRREALVACAGPVGAAVAIVRYATDPLTGEPELAIAVADAWQRQGLGRVLARRVLALAAARGHETMVAYVGGGNADGIRFFRRLGFELARHEGLLVELRATLR